VSLAFSITVHDKIDEMVTLVQSLSRPGHSICIHVDKKAPMDFHTSVKLTVECLKKRYPKTHYHLIEEPINLYWGHVSMLQSDLMCLKTLLGEENSSWQYYMNLAGSVLPTANMTIMEHVISSLDGNSIVESFPVKELRYLNRFKYVHKLSRR
jgi:beta-1,3-galactosyl-O-glycosyl-glycoprotein beta-1,6-N-acetylglucosaminyltransferase